ncbi:AzlD domain-containing protein [Clostridium sp. MB40-C1]|uniref:AzlD domain-containing protein n=1 Tax=Clostridium sp. MB40-C1 TaxID=3070996 RepID=UPI0027E15911|nr:AzlD domain-containing protein [Clostridium sp. MB40-C1]WMJ79069.1 AzlD domain-containing protein [Clostridium sp. MB40-C1]
MNKVLITILIAAIVTYLTRAVPLLLHKENKLNKFFDSFLKYIPYAALSGLLFPEILYSTGKMTTAVIGGAFASVLLLKKQNMIIVVVGTILLVYGLNLYL